MAPKTQISFAEYTDRERRVDDAVHALGVVTSVIAVAVLLILAAMWQDVRATASVAIYGISVVAVFATSAAYHTVQNPARKALLRRLDHAAIFLKIAGTYTPFALVNIGGSRGGWLLAAVWGIAAVGVFLKLGGWRAGVKTSAALYLAQGWLILLAFDAFRESLQPAELLLCLIGGGLYTVGVGFLLASRLPYHNAIWHMFVLSASACFYVAILKAVVLR